MGKVVSNKICSNLAGTVTIFKNPISLLGKFSNDVLGHDKIVHRLVIVKKQKRNFIFLLQFLRYQSP